MITAEEIKCLFLLAFSHFRICRLGDIFKSSCWYYCRYFSDFSVSYQKGSPMSPPLSPIWAIKHNLGSEDFPSSALQTLPWKLLLQEFFDRIRSKAVLSWMTVNGLQNEILSTTRQLSFIHLYVIYFVLLVSIDWKFSYAANITLGPMSQSLFPRFHVPAPDTTVFMLSFFLPFHSAPWPFSFPYPK